VLFTQRTKASSTSPSAQHGVAGEISTAPMATLPLLVIPVFLVPLFLMLHITAPMQSRQWITRSSRVA
jgi:hypothetical protein